MSVRTVANVTTRSLGTSVIALKVLAAKIAMVKKLFIFNMISLYLLPIRRMPTIEFVEINRFANLILDKNYSCCCAISHSLRLKMDPNHVLNRLDRLC